MSVINYTPADPANILVGLAILVVLCVFAYMLYQLARFYRQGVDIEDDYNVAHRMALDETTKKMGLDIENFRRKQEVMKSRSLRKKLEKKIVDDFFSKED